MTTKGKSLRVSQKVVAVKLLGAGAVPEKPPTDYTNVLETVLA